MADAMDVDPERLAAAAAEFDRLADRTTDALAALESTLATEGDSWGTDNPGTTFANSYVPGRDGVLAAIRALSGNFTGIADGMVRTAATFGRADSGLASRFGEGS